MLFAVVGRSPTVPHGPTEGLHEWAIAWHARGSGTERSEGKWRPSVGTCETVGDRPTTANTGDVMNRARSEAAYAKACEVIPGGVNSPARAFGGVGGKPIFVARGEGAYLIDLDGN